MNNEEINRYLHVEIMGKCWHDWRSMGPDWGFRCGNNCGATSSFSRNPDYCSDDSPRRLLNEVVAKVRELRLDEVFVHSLENIIPSYHDVGPEIYCQFLLCNATAEQIARAAVEAHKLTAKPAA